MLEQEKGARRKEQQSGAEQITTIPFPSELLNMGEAEVVCVKT